MKGVTPAIMISRITFMHVCLCLETHLVVLEADESASLLQHAAWLSTIIESLTHSAIWPGPGEPYHAGEQQEELGDHHDASLSRVSDCSYHTQAVVIAERLTNGPTKSQTQPRMGLPKERARDDLQRGRPARYADGNWLRSCDSVEAELEMAC